MKVEWVYSCCGLVSLKNKGNNVSKEFFRPHRREFGMLKCTILDDYQKVATSIGKWSLLEPHVKVQSLKEKRIAGAGLDVFDVEPLPIDHPFRTLPNVLATPHIGYVTKENYKIYFDQTIDTIVAFLNNNPVRKLITTDAQTIASNVFNIE